MPEGARAALTLPWWAVSGMGIFMFVGTLGLLLSDLIGKAHPGPASMIGGTVPPA